MEKADKEKKAELIKAIAEALDKNTTSMHQVWCILHSLQDACEYMEDKRYQYRTSLPADIRAMRECLVDNLDYIQNRKERIISQFDSISDALQEVIMLAGENAEGLIAITSPQMKEDLDAISDEYNN